MPTMDEINAQFDQQPVASQPSMDEINAQFNNNTQAAPVGVNNVQPVAPDQSVTKVPGFWKKAEMISSGVDRGIKNFTLALMSKIPLGDRYQNAIKQVDANATATQENNKKTYGALYPSIGEGLGEIAATLPLGGALGTTSKAATALGEIAPVGLKTIAKYGASALGGAGVLAGAESQKYDPTLPGQAVNSDAVINTLKNPASYLAPMLGTKLGTWLGASQDLAAADKVVPGIMARQIKDPSATATLSNMVFGIPAALLDMGKQANQIKNIGPDVIAPYIQQMSTAPAAKSADDLVAYSANAIQNSLKKMNAEEDKMWDAGFKTVPIKDPAAVKDDVSNAIDLLKTRKPSGYETSVGDLQDALRTGTLTANDVKQMQGIVSSASISARGLDGGVGNRLADQLKEIKDNMLNHISNSLSENQMNDFRAARAFSASKFDLFDQAPMLEKAVYDTTNAHRLVNSLVGDSGTVPAKQAAMSILNDGDKNVIAATKVQKALDAADPTKSGKVDIGKFMQMTNDNSHGRFIMNDDAYKNLQGFNHYLQNINDANTGNGVWKTAMLGTGLASAAGAMGLGGIVGGPAGAAAGLASYGAMNFVANHSPLKYIMNGLVNLSAKGLNSDSSSIYKHLIDTVGKHLGRAGYYMTDGALQHKDEKQIQGPQ